MSHGATNQLRDYTAPFSRTITRRTAASLIPALLLASLPNVPVAAQEAESCVPMLGGNPARTGEMPGPGPRENPRVLWSFPLGAPIYSTPAVVKDVVYVGTGGDPTRANVYDTDAAQATFYFYALNGMTGAVHWRTAMRGPILSSPAVVDGIVYVGSNDGNFYALDAGSGAERWHFAAGGPALSAPVVLDGRVYLGSVPSTLGQNPVSHVHALEGETGNELWSAEIPGFLLPSPAVTDGVVYVVANRSIHALIAETGKVRWEAKLVDESIGSPVVADGTVFVAVGAQRYLGSLSALDVASGTERWTVRFHRGILQSLAVANGLVYVANFSLFSHEDERPPGLYAIDAVTGIDRWTIPALPSYAGPAPAIVGDRLYWAEGDNIASINALTGEIVWALRPEDDNDLTSCVVINGLIYAGSYSGTLYAIGESG